MRRCFPKTFAILCLLLLSGAASADTRETMERNYEVFSRHAGEPVDEIRSYFRLYDWQPLGTTQLAIWVDNQYDAYLIEVEEPCSGLDFTRSIGVSSTQHVISRRFDKITFDRQVCTIRSIRPVDYRAVRKALHDGESSPTG
jgi:hypothetical protein